MEMIEFLDELKSSQFAINLRKGLSKFRHVLDTKIASSVNKVLQNSS